MHTVNMDILQDAARARAEDALAAVELLEHIRDHFATPDIVYLRKDEGDPLCCLIWGDVEITVEDDYSVGIMVGEEPNEEFITLRTGTDEWDFDYLMNSFEQYLPPANP